MQVLVWEVVCVAAWLLGPQGDNSKAKRVGLDSQQPLLADCWVDAARCDVMQAEPKRLSCDDNRCTGFRV